MTTDANSPRSFGNLLGLAQLAAILLQFAGLLWMGGRWSAEMSAVGERVTELRQIVGELAKSQAQSAIIDASQGARLETLAKRLDEIVARGFPREMVARVQRMLYNSEYKRRQAAPGVKIGLKAFGRDRRYPIVNGFRDRVSGE
jgi:hypothetical protein